MSYSKIWELPGAVRLVVCELGDGRFEAAMFEPSASGRRTLFILHAAEAEWAEDCILGLYRAEMLRRATKPIAELLADAGMRDREHAGAEVRP